MRLYGYWRSSATHRVRIALNWKGLGFEVVPTNLVQGEHRRLTYLEKNPQGLVQLQASCCSSGGKSGQR
jgi:glutathione S-transferase